MQAHPSCLPCSSATSATRRRLTGVVALSVLPPGLFGLSSASAQSYEDSKRPKPIGACDSKRAFLGMQLSSLRSELQINQQQMASAKGKLLATLEAKDRALRRDIQDTERQLQDIQVSGCR